MRLKFGSLLVVALALALAAAQPAKAIDLYWSGDAVSQGGNGTWDTTLARWGLVAGGPYGTVWTNPNTAIFGGTAGTVTLGGNMTLGSAALVGFNFQTSGYILDAASAQTLTMGGTGTSVLNGTTFNSNVNIALNAAQTWSLSGNSTINGVVSGASNLTTGAGGSLLFANTANTFTGILSMNQGTVEFKSIANVGGGNSSLGAPATAANGTINLGTASNQDTNLVYSGTTNSSSNRTINLGTTASSRIATIDVASTGNLTLTANLTSAAAAKTLNLQGSSSGVGTISGVIPNATGNIALTKNGTGTWVLSGNNAFAGGLTLNNGTLQANGSTGALGAGTLVLNGGTLDFNHSAALNFARNTTVAGNVTIISEKNTAGPGVTYTLGTLAIGAQTLSVSGGNVNSGTAGVTFSGTTTFTGNATFNITNPTGGGTTLLTLAGIAASGPSLRLTGNGNFAQSAAWTPAGGFNLILDSTYSGTATLNQANTFGSGVALNAGTLVLDIASTGSITNGPVGSATLTLAGGTVRTAGTSRIVNNVLSVTGDTTFGATGAAGILTLGGNATTTGTRTLTFNNTTSVLSGLWTLGGNLSTSGTGGATFSGGFGLNGSNRTITPGTTLATSIGGALGSTGAGNTLTIAGTGNATITGFNLATAGTGGAGNEVKTFLSGTNGTEVYTFNGAGNSTGGIELTSGIIALGTTPNVTAGTLTLNTGTTIRSDSGTARTLTSATPLAINGDVTFSNATNNGALTFQGSTQQITASNPTLTFATSLTTFNTNPLNLNGNDFTIAQTGAGAVSFNGGLSWTGARTINTGSGTGNIFLQGAMNGTSTPSLALTGSATNVFFGNSIAVTGATGGVNVNGPTVTFGVGTSTFTGGATLTSGTMVLDAATTGGPVTSGPIGNGTLTLAGGTLRAAGTSRAVNNVVSITGNTTIGAASFAGVLTLGGAMTTTGDRTVTFNNTTSVLSGGLTLGGNLTMNGTSGATFQNSVTTAGNTITFSSAGIFDLQNTAATITGLGGVTVTTGRVNMGGGGTAPTHTYSGDTNLTGGITMFHNNFSANSNININGGILEAYFGGTWSQTLGSGANQLRITGGNSGFSENGAAGLTVTLGGGAITWGSTNFAPTKLILNSSASQANATLNFTNALNLNGADRTVVANIGLSNAAATLSGIISNSTGTAGLIKEGAGSLTLSNASNSFNGGITINNGSLTFSNVGSWGTSGKNVTFTGSGTLASSAATYSGGQINTGGFTATISGTSLNFTSATGAGTLNFLNSGAGATFNLGNATAFTGNLQVRMGGVTNANPTVQFSSIGDAVGSSIQYGGTNGDSNQSASVKLTGDVGPVTFDNRSIQTIAGSNVRHVALYNSNTNAANKWVINTAFVNNISSRQPEFELRGVNAGDNDFHGVIANGSSVLNVIKTDAGKWILSGNNTFTGSLVANSGTLSVGTFNSASVAGPLGQGQFQLGGTFGAGTSALADGSGTLEYTGAGNTTNRTVQIGDSVTAANTGAGSILNNGSGALTFSAATFNPAVATATGIRILTLGGNYTASANEIQGVVRNNNTAGGGLVGVTKSGAGTWRLSSGSNTFTGNISLSATTGSAGTLEYASAGGSNAIIFSGITTGSGTLSYIGAAPLTMNGTIAAAALTTGTITLDASGTAPANTINYSNTGSLGSAGSGIKNLVLTGNNTGSNILAGLWANNTGAAATLTKNGTGTWRLSSATSSYTGNTTINAGVLEAATLANGGSNSSIGASTSAANQLLLANGTTFRYVGSSNVTSNRSFTINGTVAGDGATIESSGNGTLSFDNSVALAYGTAAQTRTLTLGGTNTGANTFGKVIANNTSAATSLVKAGTGRWVLDQANTYNGTTLITDGTLQIGSGGATGSLSTSSTITNNGTLTFNRNNAVTQGTHFANTIGGTGVVVQSGNNTLTLAGTNNYSGGTTLNAGTIAFGNGSLGSSGNVTFAGTSTLQWSSGNTQDVSSRVVMTNGVTSTFDTNGNDVNFASGIGNSSSGALTKAGVGTLILAGANSYTGTTTISGGTLEVQGSIALSSDVANDGSLVFNSSAAQSYGNGINGSGSLTKQGTGTLTLGGASTYGGETTVSNGTLLIDTAGSINGSSGVTVNGGTFRYNSSTDLAAPLNFVSGQLGGTNWNGSLGGLVIGGNQTLSPGNSPGTANTTSQTWASGGNYTWEINNATGTVGTDPGWDLVLGTGTLDITSNSTVQFNINITSLTLANAPGLATNFDDTLSYNWLIADFASTVTGFASGNFSLNTTGFQNTFNGTFSIARGDSVGGGDDSQVYLVYVPEPTTLALLGACVAFVAFRFRKRLRAA